MRNPNPIAVLSAIIQSRNPHGSNLGPYQVADLACRVARIGKQATRYAVAWCNGEAFPGQRRMIERLPDCDARQEEIDAYIDKMGEKLSDATGKMNLALAPFGILVTSQGDPRGHCLRVYDIADRGKDCPLWSI